MGILAGGFVYVKLNMGLGAALFAFLMFACIALFTLRNVFFRLNLKLPDTMDVHQNINLIDQLMANEQKINVGPFWQPCYLS
ncbi:MAG: hypothetical protein HWD58_10350 [Bacteroidota bacterium]|nr:MAG: hypothetical protein HWD58_10350 [Bacteroidota bacterium]